MLFGKDKVKLGVGPWTEEGFYQDFELPESFSEKDLKKIEKKMRWIVNKNFPIKMQEVDEKTARELHKGDPYKQELIDEIVKNKEPITVAFIGDSLENAISAQLCEGPHLNNTSELGVFKLTKTAGAYWRGDEKNPMLTRIYGVAFENEKELEAYQQKIEEAKKRDHRKLGKELDLFTFSDLVGSGLPLWTPKGTLMRNLIVNKIKRLQSAFDYEEVAIPHITKKELYETSGHWAKFKDELFHVKGKGDTEFVMKPMNCPHHTQIYASRPRSYKELPLRFVETTMVYRDEQAGELLGLSRVRAITQDDGHIFCTQEQIKQELKNIISVIKDFYGSLGMFEKGQYKVSISVRDPQTPEKYLGDEKTWQKAEAILKEIVEEEKLEHEIVPGEAAFYGPKIDFMFKDALGRQWQLATAQLDFVMPERFSLSYIDKDGQKKTPVMIHRAIAGSLERFLSVMIEHFAGAFPFWLSPEQVRILPVSKEQNDYAKEVEQNMKKAGLRAKADLADETLGKRIRSARLQKIPYIAVVGEKEAKENKLTLQDRQDNKETLNTQEAIEKLLKENE